MTDATAPTEGIAIRRPDLSPARVRRRYAAEARFKTYGRLAIAAAVIMLGILLFSIVGRGWTAFFQTQVGLDVFLDPNEIQIERNADGEIVDIDGDFRGLVNEALFALFPNVEERVERRALRNIVTRDAAIELRAAVEANPEMIDQTARIWITSSDDIDTYVKGQITGIETFEVAGVATPTGTSGEVEILTGANDFSHIAAEVTARLAELSEDRARAADAARATAGRLQGDLAEIRSELEATSDADALSLLENQVSRLEGQIQSLLSGAETASRDAEDFRNRAETVGGMEELSNRLPSYLVEINGGLVKLTAVAAERAVGEVLIPLESTASAQPEDWGLISYVIAESNRRVKDNEVAWIETLRDRGQIRTVFNTPFFTEADSREPEQAGIWGAVVGSFLTLIVTLVLAFPVGVLAAIYLEEFAPKNRLTDLIEVNINNLAAVPSIVFGLLGLAMFLNFFGLPRSAPLVGGMVLALMTLPTVIIASRAALKAVPPSIREAALGVGASKVQTVTHHVLPLAMPGILTGTIIGMAQALGETAPLLMIGMVAFIADVPSGFTDAATVLPVQIFLWADAPERAFVAKTSAAIMVLLTFLIFMNAMAVVLRKRFERRW